VVYTKTGDSGTTSLVGGTRVKKSDLRVECYGTIDELTSYIGLIRDLIIKRDRQKGKSSEEAASSVYATDLLAIINVLFSVQSIVACESDFNGKEIPQISNANIEMLEQRMDLLERNLPKLKGFVLPTGYYLSSHFNVARTICRRAERSAVRLDCQTPIDKNVLMYLNRLSDYLFIMSREMMRVKKRVEIIWRR
jgi:ATP:cob(I)alamin adenosyltransferase